MEPLDERQIKAVRKASGIDTFKIMLEMNDFYLDLLTKGGRKDEFAKLARVVYGDKQKQQRLPSSTKRRSRP
jgi:hypothetical protein